MIKVARALCNNQTYQTEHNNVKQDPVPTRQTQLSYFPVMNIREWQTNHRRFANPFWHHVNTPI